MSRYLDLVDEYLRQHPDQRVGQAYYNVLRIGWPHLAPEVDCFSRDYRLPAFLDWVERALGEESRVK
ncbi:hypothetical protein [Actinosynnema sp. NPDC020468]|uniref:hypothetical protein n=1 Tax=Actinosynnema sp. NPDC020468 TaxID=3154488 RepID=UPI0034031F93